MVSDSRSLERAASPKRSSFWNDRGVRGVLYQIIVVGLVVLAAWYLIHNTRVNLAERKIATGFDFMGSEAGYAIGEHLIDYKPSDTYGRAIVVGLLNTLMVAVLGIVFSTVLGTILGVARLSTNWLIAKIASVYVESVRNVPLLLQLFLWYQLITEGLPELRNAFQPVPDVFLSKKGLLIPVPLADPIHFWMFVALLVGIAASWWWRKRAAKVQAASGRIVPILWPSVGFILGAVVLVWLAGGAPTKLDAPVLGRFNASGGHAVSPELVALLFGLTVYTTAFIGEIVRAGILAVPSGQSEAARALGLPAGRIMTLVILPQALRVIVPPMTSQYLNLTKNSSLAVAIGFPDLVSVTNTAMNQTGQAIELVMVQMLVYLVISLGISLFMNWYNTRIRLIER